MFWRVGTLRAASELAPCMFFGRTLHNVVTVEAIVMLGCQ